MTVKPRHSVLQTLRRHNPEEVAELTRRSLRVTKLKRILPAAGVLLLVALVVAPELRTGPDTNRVAYNIGQGAASQPASRLLGAKYHGTDQQGQPFTVTADSAVETGADDVELVAPMGDITLKSGAWLMMKAANGRYRPTSKTLELRDGVTLYRNDGTILSAANMEIGMGAGNANTAVPVQVQGPFGTLTAQNGFNLTNRGANITFNGPATLVLTQGQ